LSIAVGRGVKFACCGLQLALTVDCQNVCEHHESTLSGHDVVQQAVDCMVGVAVNINEMKRRHEKTVRVMELQTRLLPRYLAHDLTALGQLILEVLARYLASASCALCNSGSIGSVYGDSEVVGQSSFPFQSINQNKFV